MPLDFDPFDDLDMDFDPFDELDNDFDHQVDSQDLQIYELNNHGDYSLNDLNHDHFIDQFQNDLNYDGLIDEFQVDLDHNSLVDRFETQLPGTTTFDYDIHGDGSIDFMDTALGKYIYSK